MLSALEEAGNAAGVLVTARRTFDLAHAWGGKHPMGVPMVVLTHRVPQEWVKPGSPFTFVTDGIESAIRQAKDIAGNKSVAVGAPSAVQQALQAGLSTRSISTSSPCSLEKASAFSTTSARSRSSWRAKASQKAPV